MLEMDQGKPVPKPGRGRARGRVPGHSAAATGLGGTGEGMEARAEGQGSFATGFGGASQNLSFSGSFASGAPEGIVGSGVSSAAFSGSQSSADGASVCGSMTSGYSGRTDSDKSTAETVVGRSPFPSLPNKPSSNYGEEPGVVRTINEGFNKVGTRGNMVNIETNYYHLNRSPDFRLYQYRVDFTPVEDDTLLKKMLLRQHESKLGKYVFDGSVMYKSRLIPPDLMTLESVSQTGNVVYTIRTRLVGQVSPEDSMYLQFYNIVMRKAMTLLGMEELGRNLYDRNAAIRFDTDHLHLWPGFVTAIRNHEMGTLLCVEVTHKVLRTSTVLDLMKSLKGPNMSQIEYEKAVRAEIEDSIVMTHYNRRTYKISNIDFKTTPASSFRGQDGTIETYAAYYQRRYGLTLTPEEMRQPLLVCPPKKRDINKGVTGDIYLIPSLCNPTGLSDDMRKDFILMIRLSKHLHMDPMTRKNKLDEFITKLNETPAVQEEFAAWNVEFCSAALKTTARVLRPEKIIVGPEEYGRIDANAQGDWTRNMKSRKMLVPEHLKKWLIFTPPAEADNVKSFLITLKNMGNELGIEVSEPLDTITYDVNKYDTNTLDQHIKPWQNEEDQRLDLDLVFFILPNNALRRYAEIKHYCSLKLGVPSQCYLAKNLRNKNLNSVATKVMIQITAKMGGVPWSINVPLKKSMVLGFDVYHCSARKGESAGALVGTTSPSLTRYTSLVSFHKDKSELAQNLCNDFVTILQEYRANNKCLPDRILMYRDGVGEGQIQFVLNHEVKQMLLGIRDMYAGTGQANPMLSFIIVTKKINTRAFLEGNRNLSVGTVIDQAITLPERYDFFLVSQDVRQGTVSPTNYNVVYDESKLNADKLQLLSYKLCHLYYNWSGTVAVPAPCQYAHKLAYLTGVAVGSKPAAQLTNKLWYL